MQVRNTPSAEGRSLGDHLARFADGAERRLRDRAGADIPERCASCAFRAGTAPNGCLPTVMDALKALMEGDTFLCHATPPGVEPAPCAGFLLLGGDPDGGTNASPGRMPWPYSDEVDPA